MPRSLSPLIMTFALVVAGRPSAAQFPPDSFTNLKVLPKDINRDTLVTMMAGFTRALGVRCTYCHVGEENRPLSTYDFAADDKQSKRTARVMIQMVHHINHEHLADAERRVNPPLAVECFTCHRGTVTPRTLQDMLWIAYQSGGIDSSLAAYRALRERFYGRATYDFGEVALADVATRVERSGHGAGAGRFLALNVEMNPNSNFARRQHANHSIRHAFADDGADSGAATYRAFKTRYGSLVGEMMLNTIGYDLLRTQQVEPALLVFRFAASEFPTSANAFDSLGEAYMVKGDKAMAIENYERSLALDPGNANAKAKLRELRGS